jgi:hypothetical protein
MTRRAPLYALYVADAISLSGNAVAQVAIPWFVLTTSVAFMFLAMGGLLAAVVGYGCLNPAFREVDPRP